MGDLRPVHSDEYTEEETEPFSQSELEFRLRSHRAEEMDASTSTSVPLDDLLVPPEKGIRILMRPLTRDRSVSPSSRDNWEWLALQAEAATPDPLQHKVLAVTQTHRDIKFAMRIVEKNIPTPPIHCDLYYDPASDNLVLVNRSYMPVSLSRASYDPASTPAAEYEVNPDSIKSLTPGTWRIRANQTDVLDFRVLEKPPATLTMPLASRESPPSDEQASASAKRPAPLEEDPTGTGKKIRPENAAGGGDVTMFLRPQFLRPQADSPDSAASVDRRIEDGVAEDRTDDRRIELVRTNGHALLDMKEGHSVEVSGGSGPDPYQITKLDTIASTTQSTVFKADYSHIAEGIITVKVLRTRPLPSSNSAAGAKPQDTERNVIHQANTWLRELELHDGLQHDSIVRLYGGDARHLSLYMEHIDASDITARGLWRNNESDYFCGDRGDADRILRDIAGALHYIHRRDFVHNDIKPPNILYSRERGAVLCDFGLSTESRNPHVPGGTPYYLPPEFIGGKLRGAPADVWALGITMLYVLRKISYPDARGRRHHPQRLHWLIADLNRRGQPYSAAVSQMQQWLGEVSEARSKLNPLDILEGLVARMLAPQPRHRVTMSQIIEELFPEQSRQMI